MKPNNLEQIQDEFTHFVMMADHFLQKDYLRYKRYVAEKTPDDEGLLILPYASYCFGIYVETCNDMERDEQIKDLLK